VGTVFALLIYMNLAKSVQTKLTLTKENPATTPVARASQFEMKISKLFISLSLLAPVYGHSAPSEFSSQNLTIASSDTSSQSETTKTSTSRSSTLFVGPNFIDSLAEGRVKNDKRRKSELSVPGLAAGLDWDKFDGVEARPNPVFNKNSITNTIPTDIPNHADGRDVGQRVMNKGLQSLVEGRYFNNPELARAAKEIEQKLKTEVSLGGREPGSVSHSFGMQVLAFEQRAKLDYKGFFDASMDYNAANSNFQMALTEQLSDTSKVLINHESATSTSMLNLHFDWN